MKRSETLALIIAITALTLAGCAGETATNTSGTSGQQSQQASVTPVLTVTSIPLNKDGTEIFVPDNAPQQTMQFVIDADGKATPKK